MISDKRFDSLSDADPVRRLRETVLRIIQRGRGTFGWHAIASRLSGCDVVRVPDLPTVFEELLKDGLVILDDQHHWNITLKGEAFLEMCDTP